MISFNKTPKYGLRKLTVGFASVMIGMTIYGLTDQTLVHAASASDPSTATTGMTLTPATQQATGNNSSDQDSPKLQSMVAEQKSVSPTDQPQSGSADKPTAPVTPVTPSTGSFSQPVPQSAPPSMNPGKLPERSTTICRTERLPLLSSGSR